MLNASEYPQEPPCLCDRCGAGLDHPDQEHHCLIEVSAFSASAMPGQLPPFGKLVIEREIPEERDEGWEERWTARIEEQAQTLEKFLRQTLPQGVYFRLVGVMLSHAAPKFRIGFEKEGAA